MSAKGTRLRVVAENRAGSRNRFNWSYNSWLFPLLGAALVSFGCRESERSDNMAAQEERQGKETTKEQIERLLVTAEDETLSRTLRGDALVGLREFPELPFERIFRLLDREYDYFTFQVIQTLGKIGDPRALGKLRELQSPQDFIIIPGQINRAL